LTERRTTITRTWRPAAPAPRVDDYVEARVECTRMPERRRQPELIEERRSIGRRLENWGMWANMGGNRGGGADCMTGVICESMRRHAVGELHPPAPVNDRIDTVDAERINGALAKINQAHRNVLQWTYVVCAKPWAVAGACGFPSAEYNDRLLEAQEAIEAASGTRKQHA
jgi:hypothetical protein